MFYRLAINLIFCLTGYKSYTLIEWAALLIPIKKISNGFTAAFLVFYLFIPFLTVLVRNLTEKQHTYLLLLCGFTYVFLGTIPGFSVTMNYVSWFCVVFFIASYIRLYPKRIYNNTKFWGWLTLIILAVDILTITACAWISAKTGKQWAYRFLTDSNSFLATATAVCAFLLFKNINIPYNRFLNTVAASTFAVFLIHANSDTMRQWLWRDTIDCVGHYGIPLMPFYAMGSVLLIYTVCTLIDQIRIRFAGKPFFTYWDKLGDVLAQRYKRINTAIMAKTGKDN